MKSFSSILAWLLLIAVLAVPSFLFYNWWSKSKLQVSAEVTPQPVMVNVFPADKTAPAAAARPGPNTTSVPAQAAAVAHSSLGPPGERPPSASANPPERKPEVSRPAEAGPIEEEGAAEASPPAAEKTAAAAQPQALQQAATVQQSSPADPPAQEVAASTEPKPVSYFEPKTERDPILSVGDYLQINAERRAREEAAKSKVFSERSKPKEPGPETRITLQGIVGNAAIINDNMVSTGQTVRGVKIVRIGADYIIGEYQGKRFRKVLK